MSEISYRGLVTSSQALPPGARIERHRHPLHQIVYPSSGAVSVTTPAGTWITPANRAIWIPAGCWHEYEFHGTHSFTASHCTRTATAAAPRRRPCWRSTP